jgi:hypothetical protein
VRAVLEREPADPRSVNPAADRDLAAVAMKCLAKEPAGRYASAADLADDLDRWLRGEPTKARPPGPVERARRWVWRNATAAVTLPVLAVALAVIPWLAEGSLIRVELLPTALDTPLGWTRLLLTTPGLYPAAVALSVLLVLGSGWLIVRVTRPATTAAALGFALATVLLSHAAHQMIQAPYSFENARGADEYARWRVHPVADVAENWTAEAAKPGTPAAAEADYLRQFLPADRRSLGLAAVADDLYALREEAAQVNRMRAAYRQTADEHLTGLVLTLPLTLITTWLVMYLDRSRGRRWANLLLYAELTLTTLLAVGLPVGAAIDLAPRHPTWGAWALVAGFGVACLLWAAAVWASVWRRWRWFLYLRLGVYLLAASLVGLVLVGMAVARGG